MTVTLTRRATLTGIVALAAIRPAFASRTLDVLELFTSQGCSSCPPADKLLGAYAGDGDILALSYNVDYWDYLGWKDTLARAAYTERQYAYAKTRGDRRVYTPQMIVNGADHVVGSDREAIEIARRRTRVLSGDERPELTLSVDPAKVTVEVGRGRAPKQATVFLAAFAPALEVRIARGENAGHRGTYHNVVRALAPAGSWNGSAVTVTADRATLGGGAVAYAALLQTGPAGRPGPILAAAMASRG